ncbi:hypothetical protein E2C01_089125 [Portunus trituberculatus]|uniref:Uncharacterized protein n=1 Tax=Portunus trituberculatus TaxID=210409 RepID=A0A5B7JLD8_PORTR|nr:hypothetical protein [Portunus trituberculatus]
MVANESGREEHPGGSASWAANTLLNYDSKRPEGRFRPYPSYPDSPGQAATGGIRLLLQDGNISTRTSR